MPIPSPKSGEKEQEFVSRCISAIYDEYGKEQAAAICYSKYRETKKENIVKDIIKSVAKLLKIGDK